MLVGAQHVRQSLRFDLLPFFDVLGDALAAHIVTVLQQTLVGRKRLLTLFTDRHGNSHYRAWVVGRVGKIFMPTR